MTHNAIRIRPSAPFLTSLLPIFLGVSWLGARPALGAPEVADAAPPASATDVSPTHKTSSALATAGTFVFGARVGFELAGAGQQQLECSGIGSYPCQAEVTTSIDDKSYAQLGVEGLFHLAPGLRVGLGYSAIPRSSVSLENEAKTYALGTEHSFLAVLEGIISLSPRTALALRLQAGPRLLATSSELENDNHRMLDSCQVAHCFSEHGPFWGASYGTMAGIILGDRPRWRIDFAVDRSYLPIGGFELTDAGNGVHLTPTLYTTRAWLSAGVEI